MATYYNSDLFVYGERGLAAAGFGPKTRDTLAHYGIRTASDAIDMAASDLVRIPGIGQQLASRLLALIWAQ